jgi:hypothetical protein
MQVQEKGTTAQGHLPNQERKADHVLREDEVMARRLACHDAIARALASVQETSPELSTEDMLSALAAVVLGILAQLPEHAYARFLADFAHMRMQGLKRLAEAKGNGLAR